MLLNQISPLKKKHSIRILNKSEILIYFFDVKDSKSDAFNKIFNKKIYINLSISFSLEFF